jgi:hypothetical protein
MTPATHMPAACLNACWPTPGARAAPACIDEPAAPGCIMLKTLIIATVLLPRLAFAQLSTAGGILLNLFGSRRSKAASRPSPLLNPA